MARPREFDENEVLEAALQVFWERGFEGASLEDLLKATGLVRASLYGAFGDKAGLYQRSLEHYLERHQGLDRTLEQPSVRAGVRELLQRWIGIACPKSGPKGCFVLLSAGLGPEGNDLARQVATTSNRLLQSALESAIARGQASGELGRSIAPAQLASMLSVILQGLATGARLGKSRAELQRVAETAVELLG